MLFGFSCVASIDEQDISIIKVATTESIELKLNI